MTFDEQLTYREVILINGVRSAIKRLDHGAPWAKESTSDFLKAVLEEAKVEKTLGDLQEERAHIVENFFEKYLGDK